MTYERVHIYYEDQVIVTSYGGDVCRLDHAELINVVKTEVEGIRIRFRVPKKGADRLPVLAKVRKHPSDNCADDYCHIKADKVTIEPHE